MEIEWREALYRKLARVPGLPAGLRPELIKRAERCLEHFDHAYMVGGPRSQGCKGAIGQ